MEDDGLGDWRIQAATRLAKDVPAAFAGGPSHKTGTPVHLATSTRDTKNRPVGFVTPSAVALALNIAMKSADGAKELYAGLVFKDVLTPQGKGRNINYKDVELLYDYFEYCMIAVTFSFQALETYCNHTIANELTGTFDLQRRKDVKTYTPLELEREASTEEKLCNVLPVILGIASPKGKRVWENFIKLKRARDATTHLKSTDQYPNQYSKTQVVDRDTLFYQFLNNDPADFPIFAIVMIKYFAEVKGVPRWLLEPLKFISKRKK